MGFTTSPGNESISPYRDGSAVLTDLELLARASENDSRAFGVLFDRHSAAVFRYAWGFVRQDADAQELLQDTFLTAWDRRSSIRLVGESALPWLLVTCRNHARNQTRRNRYRASLPLRESDAASVIDPAELRWVREAIDSLEETDRMVCELCLVDGASYREAALVLGSTEAAVAKRLQRARAKLRKAVVRE
jgi:RNA polymerase sigma-70 factor (ECF subfamily)